MLVWWNITKKTTSIIGHKMKQSTKILSAAGVLLLMMGALAAQMVQVRQLADNQRQYTANTGELIKDVLVGQTFHSGKSNLSAVSVQFATYANRHSSHPILFYLRTSYDSRDNVRTASVEPKALGDNQMYRFNFEPITDSKDKTYFFFVVSPESVPGDAATVDIDSRDPYVGGSAFLVRGQGSTVTDPAVIARSGKPAVDLTFATYHNVSARQAVIDTVISTIRSVVQTYPQKRTLYEQWVKIAAIVTLFIALALLIIRPGKREKIFLWLVVLWAVALAVRLWYAQNLPFTNDEGNYLYDARTLLTGHLAGGDGYVKAPLVIAWIALWHFLWHGSLLAARFSSLVIGSLTLFPLYFIGRELWGKKTGLAIAALWALAGSAIVFNVYVHTQPLALFFGTAGIAVLLMALHGTTPRLTFITVRRSPAAVSWFFFAGVLLGLGVASRKSILGLGLAPLLSIVVLGKNWREKMKELLAVGCGFLLVMIVFLGGAYYGYGLEGIKEAVGLNSAEDGIATVDPAEADKATAYSLRGMTPFFRESLPLIFLAVIGWGLTLEKSARRLLNHGKKYLNQRWLTAIDYWLPKIVWVLPAMVFMWAWRFFGEYEGSAFMIMGIPWLWYAFALGITVIALWPHSAEENIAAVDDAIVSKSTQPLYTPSPIVASSDAIRPLARLLVASLLSTVWLGGITFFYMNWIKFHANYIAEFIPPLVILGGAGLSVTWVRLRSWVTPWRRVASVAFVIVVAWAMFVSNYITYNYEHTGTFDQKATMEAAAWAANHISFKESIFTGAALIPYLSGHETALNIAHPRWYAYEFTRTNPKRIETFLPAAAAMQKAFREARWVLLDQQTGFSFLREYSDIESGLATQFRPVIEIENGSNPLTFYERIK